MEPPKAIAIILFPFYRHGHQFGTHDHRVLDDCPIARSLAEIVDSGKPFIWLPNQLPYFVESLQDISIRCKGKTLVAVRLDDGVPVLEEIIQLHTNSSAFQASFSSAKPDKGVESEQSFYDPPPGGEGPVLLIFLMMCARALPLGRI